MCKGLFMKSDNQYIYFFAFICSVVIFSSHEVICAAEKSVAKGAQEQCLCKECDKKWFKTSKAHPYTEQEKIFAYVWQALSQNNITNNEFHPLIPLVLGYVFENYQYTSETWLEAKPLCGKFYALHYPNLRLTNGKVQRIFAQDGIVFNEGDLTAVDSALREPFKSSMAISTDKKFKLEVSWTQDGQKNLIQGYVLLDHAKRIQQLIAAQG